MENTFDSSEECALRMDREDPLARFRDQFYIPEGIIYMDGNSLGLLSKDAESVVNRVLNEWKQLVIRGWLEAQQPWFYFAERLGAMASQFVGASPNEVIATGTTTINIHSLVSTFYQPADMRTRIIADELNFPTDIYALRSQVMLKNLDPAKHLILVQSSDGRTLHEDTIAKQMDERVVLALLPSVLYRSGQLLDIPYLTRKAHEHGIIIGFDCSHSVGAIPHYLDDWDVDFAMWCSYKYMNGGPGAPAFLYINRRHFERMPMLTGWFGYVKNKQFDMLIDFEHEKSAGGWQISSPSILSSAALEGSLSLLLDAGIKRIRVKSLKMTSYLMFLIDKMLSHEPYNFRIGTPSEDHRRGGHVAIEHKEAWRICEALKTASVIPDFRLPDILRFAPVALYNTYHELWQIVHLLKDIIDHKKYEQFSPTRKEIS
ncbi:MAG: kynureninase [Candidatus Fischerbacteria bacterium RBG_13_37_8]|uniref:Kynureninase n=1 Tax=Candidatus Fischerbacteria bacterium RBG_13_37_8 TaxID=1817863 RepID=A0A1F5V759_9BACT|nr:MAG: kynureninase [Candidatus Fischerbacteria bacterium RBG_13_37_8]